MMIHFLKSTKCFFFEGTFANFGGSISSRLLGNSTWNQQNPSFSLKSQGFLQNGIADVILGWPANNGKSLPSCLEGFLFWQQKNGDLGTNSVRLWHVWHVKSGEAHTSRDTMKVSVETPLTYFFDSVWSCLKYYVWLFLNIPQELAADPWNIVEGYRHQVIVETCIQTRKLYQLNSLRERPTHHNEAVVEPPIRT